jgi:hypothetical protein
MKAVLEGMPFWRGTHPGRETGMVKRVNRQAASRFLGRSSANTTSAA